MKIRLCAGLSLAVLLFASAAAAQDRSATKVEELIHHAENPKPTAAYRWLEITLAASARDVERNTPRPTILARCMAIVLTAMYDAWAAYDDKAVGTRLGAKLRRPASERTQRNKEIAIAHAAYRALLFV